ncbi:hypothetical protein TI04_00695 [Achromatium sp. WMS2]|nr:hypothetical protein TI04_00695 [Achromatium sp. WMS2]
MRGYKISLISVGILLTIFLAYKIPVFAGAGRLTIGGIGSETLQIIEDANSAEKKAKADAIALADKIQAEEAARVVATRSHTSSAVNHLLAVGAGAAAGFFAFNFITTGSISIPVTGTLGAASVSSTAAGVIGTGAAANTTTGVSMYAITSMLVGGLVGDYIYRAMWRNYKSARNVPAANGVN